MGCNSSAATYSTDANDSARKRAQSRQGERTVKAIEGKQVLFDQLLVEGNINQETTNMFQQVSVGCFLRTKRKGGGESEERGH
jgi:hypothetical protein